MDVPTLVRGQQACCVEEVEEEEDFCNRLDISRCYKAERTGGRNRGRTEGASK